MPSHHYTINFSDPNRTPEGSFNISPGQFDGPGGSSQNTDLRLYGQGTLLYGEGLNENIVRLLENFASPEDFHAIVAVDTGANTVTVAGNQIASFPDAASITIKGSTGNDGTYTVDGGGTTYSSATDQTVVAFDQSITDATVDGEVGNDGLPSPSLISTPLVGQTWYNKTTNKILMYNGTDWVPSASTFVTNVAPTNALTGDLWYDTVTDHLYVWGEDNAWHSTMDSAVGNLDMQTYKIVNLGEPTNLQDAATKNYVDSQLSGVGGFLPLSGGTLTGSLILNADPTVALGAATKQYVDAQVATGDPAYVNVTGDTMTGALILNADPTVALGAATKQYVDNASFVSISGDTMTNFLTLSGNPVNALHAATKQYVDTAVGGGGSIYVPLDGSIDMTGLLTLSGDPTALLHAATKQYVDSEVATVSSNISTNYVPKSGTTMTGLLTLSGDPVSGNGAATKNYVDNNFVADAGGAMSGPLTLNADPTVALGAATKQYVDSFAAPTMRWGQVSTVGAITRGTGFTSTKVNTGRIRINMTGENPVGEWVVTISFPGTAPNYRAHSVYREAAGQFLIITKFDDNTYVDTGFYFIAIQV